MPSNATLHLLTKKLKRILPLKEYNLIRDVAIINPRGRAKCEICEKSLESLTKDFVLVNTLTHITMHCGNGRNREIYGICGGCKKFAILHGLNITSHLNRRIWIKKMKGFILKKD